MSAISSLSSSSSRTRIPVLPTRIDGYDILRHLGSGGMGSVYLAYEPLLDRLVALKLLTRHSDDRARAKLSARFLSEAVLTGKLGHAGIVPIHHVGFDQQYGYYYTMRYVEGRTLAEIIRGVANKDPVITSQFSLTGLLTIFLRVCKAVAFAHNHGVIHRDIKPSNIIVAEFGDTLVLDWGLAKLSGPDCSKQSSTAAEHVDKLNELRKKRGTTTQVFLTKEQKPAGGTSILKQLHQIKPGSDSNQITDGEQILGTPGYLSPEQASGLSNLTPRSDVYSLGVTLYEILTRRLPVEILDNPAQMVSLTMTGQIVPIKQRPEAVRLPQVLCDIVNRALALKPEDRYADAKELATELELYLEGKSAWKSIVDDDFSQTDASKNWNTPAPELLVAGKEGIVLRANTSLQCKRHSMGDFRFECEFWADSADLRWMFSVGILEVSGNQQIEPRYEVKIGIAERPFIELLRNGERLQRRFDVRLQSNQVFTFKCELEESTLRVWINEQKFIDYTESFPQTGGAIEMSVRNGLIYVRRAQMLSRGAPLHLSFMILPDRLYRVGRYADARDLYRQVVASHPDREEGLLALYKAGLCSARLNDSQAAFDEFTRLEGTMYDHCCALGMAQIGMLDGSIEWAWEALKNGFRRHRAHSIGNEMWFALLGLVEHLNDETRYQDKINCYKELLTELDPEPLEAARVTFNMLDLVHRFLGLKRLRMEAADLLPKFTSNVYVAREALMALSRGGIDESLTMVAANSLDYVLQKSVDVDLPRLYILRAEIFASQSYFSEASRCLRDAVLASSPASSDRAWARGWQALLKYLQGEYQPALTEIHELMVQQRRSAPQQTSYLRMLEGVAYLARKQRDRGLAALQDASEVDCVWGRAAVEFLTEGNPTSLMNANYSTHQMVEALFLVGECFWHMENFVCAESFYRACQDPEHARAMFTRSINSRLNVLTKRKT